MNELLSGRSNLMLATDHSGVPTGLVGCWIGKRDGAAESGFHVTEAFAFRVST